MEEVQKLMQELNLHLLREEIAKGVNSGHGTPAEQVFSRLKVKYRAMAEAKEAEK